MLVPDVLPEETRMKIFYNPPIMQEVSGRPMKKHRQNGKAKWFEQMTANCRLFFVFASVEDEVDAGCVSEKDPLRRKRG